MNLNDWKQAGEIYIWKYFDCSASFSGWHVAASGDGANSIKELLAAFKLVNYDCHRSVKICILNERIKSIPGCNSKAVSVSKLKFYYFPKDDLKYHLDYRNDILSIELGNNSLDFLYSAFIKLVDDQMDYYVHPDPENDKRENGFWFWGLK